MISDPTHRRPLCNVDSFLDYKRPNTFTSMFLRKMEKCGGNAGETFRTFSRTPHLMVDYEHTCTHLPLLRLPGALLPCLRKKERPDRVLSMASTTCHMM